MKFLITLLALPAAVLAAPTPTEVAAHDDNPPRHFYANTANAFGARISDYQCFVTSHWSKPIEQVMTSAYCKQQNSAYPTAVCKPIKLCLRYPQCTNYNDLYNLCGYKEEISELYCAHDKH
ncbi:hypothetical protein QBC43DRAFT_366975 [Cladorrhinum sp. PSN259]|nr:hypothetical protein QBC43DRAFT_366975 [Cladorrhinum sp. PSN259]